MATQTKGSLEKSLSFSFRGFHDFLLSRETVYIVSRPLVHYFLLYSPCACQYIKSK